MATALDEETRKKTQVVAPAFPQNPPPGGSIYAGARRPEQAMRDAMPATAQAVDDAKERVTSAFQQGNTAAGVGQVVRGAVMAPLVAATEVGANLLGAAGDVAGAVAKPVAQAAYSAVTGSNDKLFAGGATPAAATVPGFQRGSLPSPAPGTGSVGTGARAANSLDNLNARATAPAPGQPPAAPTVDPDSPQARGYTQIGPDIFRKGNSFSDEAGTRDGGFGARAPVTAQANAAAENLAGGFGANQQALARLQAANAQGAATTGAQPQQLAMPSVKTSANDWETRNNLRNLRVSANSLSNDGKWGGRNGVAPDVAAYLAAVETDNAGRQGKNPLAQEMLQQLGATQRTGMTETGATQRAAMTEAGANTRATMTNDVQRGELAVKQGEFGIRSRSARQLEEAQTAFLTARTPQERAQAAQTLRVLSGKGDMPTAPSGYRWAADGNLQAIPGGPGDKAQQGRPMPTAAASGLLGNRENLRRAETALSLLNGEQLPGGAAGDPNATGVKGYLPNQMLNRVDPKGVDTRAAIADLGSLIIHDRSGAAVTAAEFPRLAPFVPTEKDDPATARKKLDQFVKNYRANIEETSTFYREQGYNVPDFEPRGQQQQAPQDGQPQPAQVPQPGEVRRGYRFKGGNPADQANWEAAP
mgnify:CR=1 FL=1